VTHTETYLCATVQVNVGKNRDSVDSAGMKVYARFLFACHYFVSELISMGMCGPLLRTGERRGAYRDLMG
jgi:hypothetical protein